MARRRYGRKKRRGSHKMTVPIALMAPVAMMGYRAYKQISAKDMGGLSRDFTGFDITDNSVDIKNLIPTYGPLLAGVIIHKAAGRFGVNNAIARTGVPLVRI